MARMTFIALALLVGCVLSSASLVAAQGQPGGPPVSTGNQRPPHNPPPPPGYQSKVPPEVRNAPYNGPSTKAPPGLTAPRTPQEASQVAQQLQNNPAVAAAHQASQTVIAARRAFGQRMRQGQLPTEADKQHGSGYQIPPRRSETPLDGIAKLLTAGASAAPPPAAEPVAEPTDEPDQQAYFGGFLCFVWENFFLDKDGRGDDYFGSQGLNYCFPPATNEGVIYIHVSMDVYKCGAYLITWDICIGQQHWYDLWPSCEATGVTYLWCGGGNQAPRAMYPQDQSGAYFLRVFGQIQTVWGTGQTYVDSEVIPYRCYQGLGVWC